MNLSNRMYNLVIGLMITYALAANYFVVQFFPYGDWITAHPYLFNLSYLISCVLGAYLCSSDKSLITFIGANFIIIPFGLVVSQVVVTYTGTEIVKAIEITAIITAVMTILGTIFPAFFKSIGTTLFVALLVIIVALLVSAFVFHTHLVFLDYLIVLVFSGFIGYDWAIANSQEKTLSNAINSSVNIFMDIINIFISILSIIDED